LTCVFLAFAALAYSFTPTADDHAVDDFELALILLSWIRWQR